MTPVAEAVFATLTEHRLVSVIRAARPEWALAAARAVIRGGIQLVEVTYSVPDAPSVMRELRGEAATIGAGTVLTPAEAHAALDAGARFLIAPNLSPDVAAIAREAGVLYC